MNFSEPALYRHFKDKTDILKGVLEFYKLVMKTGLETVLLSDLSGADKVKGVMDFQFNHFSTHPAVVMVIFSETSFQYDKVLSKAVFSILQEKQTLLELVINQGQKDNTIRTDIEAPQLAAIIMGSMRFTILRWRLTDFKFNLLDEGELLWKTISKLLKCDKE
jgi:AcrR family transcriptional regulator